MLAIRMQRTGRKGHAMYRMVVQDAHRSPTSGKIVAYLGSFNPHTKDASIDKTKADFYLEHGAQPSPRAALILKAEKVKLPKWVAEPKNMKRSVRNPEKRRSTAPAQPVAKEEPVASEEASAEVKAEEPAQEAEVLPSENEQTAGETPAIEEAPAES